MESVYGSFELKKDLLKNNWQSKPERVSAGYKIMKWASGIPPLMPSFPSRTTLTYLWITLWAAPMIRQGTEREALWLFSQNEFKNYKKRLVRSKRILLHLLGYP